MPKPAYYVEEAGRILKFCIYDKFYYHGCQLSSGLIMIRPILDYSYLKDFTKEFCTESLSMQKCFN